MAELKKILSYPANDIDKLLQQGIYAVETVADRDAIANTIKTTNRTVYVRATEKMYVWKNGAWEDVTPGGEGDGVTITTTASDTLQAVGLRDTVNSTVIMAADIIEGLTITRV